MIRGSLTFGVVALAAACARPDPQAFWTALSAADPAAARAAATTGAERRCADALEATLAGGSAAGAAHLIALGADTGAGAARDWARLLLLHLLRVEGEWPRLANLYRDHPELELTENSVPVGMRGLPRAEIAPPEMPVQLAWQKHGTNLPIVAARLAGERGAVTLSVVLDTGAASCTITTATAERLGVRFLGDEPLPVTGIAGQTASGRSAVLPELALGPWTLRDLPILVLPTLGLDDGDSVSALLGWDVLQHVAIEVSPKNRTIVIARSTADANRGERNLVLLTEPLVRLHCGDEPLLLLLDTGAVSTHLTRDAVARLGLESKPAGLRAFSGVAGASKVDADLIPHLSLRCGKVLFTLGDLPAYDGKPMAQGLPRSDGGLGYDLLGTVHVVIDGPARTLTLREE